MTKLTVFLFSFLFRFILFALFVLFLPLLLMWRYIFHLNLKSLDYERYN